MSTHPHLLRALRARIHRRTHSTRRGDQDGLITVESIIWIPIVMAVICMVIGFARYRASQIAVFGIARDAARAASQGPTMGQGEAAARDVAQTGGEHLQAGCQGEPDLSVTGTWRPGGVVTAQVTCTVSLADLTVPGFPGTVQIRQEASAPIETWLQGDTP